MKKLDPTMAQQVAEAVSAFQQQPTGYAPKAVTVVWASGWRPTRNPAIGTKRTKNRNAGPETTLGV